MIEVKSTLRSGPEVLDHCNQMKGFREFLTKALVDGADETSKLIGWLADSRIPVFGFAFESLVQADTIAENLLLEGDFDPIYVLDVARSWDNEIKKEFAALGAKPTREAVMAFVDRMRDPNGFSFWVDGYNDKDTRKMTFHAAVHAHAIDALGIFVKGQPSTLA